MAAYLYFISSGQIKCAENGTHFRPNHHAEYAYTIYRTLDTELNSCSAFITRTIKKSLPSFNDQFTTAVPLTRIRDIAHRNDIPSQLKNEIKNTLQNKLHRSAEPTDLKTCENLLARIRPDHSLSSDFKREFEIFY